MLVLEQHDIAGGNLHTFTEEGYEFDTGLHYIGGKIGDKRSPQRKLLDYIIDEEGVEWEKISVVVHKTSNSKLRGVLSYHYGDYGEIPGRGAFAVNALITEHFHHGAYYPVGGPRKISESIVKLIETWGGKVLVRANVDSILVDNKNRAYGVVVKGERRYWQNPL
ncbi:hypothetical protein ACHAWF_011456 [Thalassiosira exigua]